MPSWRSFAKHFRLILVVQISFLRFEETSKVRLASSRTLDYFQPNEGSDPRQGGEPT
jgi:hypothetical protein